MEIWKLLELKFHTYLSTAEVMIHSTAMENIKKHIFYRLYPPIDKTRLRTSHKHCIIKLFSATKYDVHVETFWRLESKWRQWHLLPVLCLSDMVIFCKNLAAFKTLASKLLVWPSGIYCSAGCLFQKTSAKGTNYPCIYLVWCNNFCAPAAKRWYQK